jgi:hypothetical protein
VKELRFHRDDRKWPRRTKRHRIDAAFIQFMLRIKPCHETRLLKETSKVDCTRMLGRCQVKIRRNAGVLQRYLYGLSLAVVGRLRQKSIAGFAVRESHGGRSTLSFSYRIVAKPFGSREPRLPMVSLPKLTIKA